MPNNADLPPMPCPLCNNCDHDMRGGLLELANNIKQNFDAAVEKVLDGCEATDDGAEEFAESIIDLASVRGQITALMGIVPDLMVIKAVNAE